MDSIGRDDNAVNQGVTFNHVVAPKISMLNFLFVPFVGYNLPSNAVAVDRLLAPI